MSRLRAQTIAGFGLAIAGILLGIAVVTSPFWMKEREVPMHYATKGYEAWGKDSEGNWHGYWITITYREHDTVKTKTPYKAGDK